MRIHLQRVRAARVTVAEEDVGAIGRGLVLLVGVGRDDTEAEARRLARKVAALRVFPDERGRFDRDLKAVGGAALVVPQFTLYGDCRRGRRPSFDEAAPPDTAAPLCEVFADALRAEGVTVATGRFGADMQVAIHNDGPVTLLLESETC